MKPREIFLNACKDIEAKLLPMGYKFIKSEHALIRKTKDFIFEIDFWSSSSNKEGRVIMEVKCLILDRYSKCKECLFGDNLGYFSDDNFMDWNLCGETEYQTVIKDIVNRIKTFFIPLTERFINDLPQLVEDVVNVGFYPNRPVHPYGSHYVITMSFLEKYATKKQLDTAIQKYIDLMSDVEKKNFQYNLSLYNEGKDIKNGVFLPYIEAIVKNDLEMVDNKRINLPKG